MSKELTDDEIDSILSPKELSDTELDSILVAPSPPEKPPNYGPAPKLQVSSEHEQQSFNRKVEAIKQPTPHAGPKGVAAITAIPPEQAEALQEPVSQRLFGKSLSDIADYVFPEQQRPDAGIATEEGVTPLPPTVYDMVRRAAKNASGIADWMQSPEAIGAAAVEAVTAGGATPVVAHLLGAQFLTQGGKQAITALDDIRKNGITPENAEAFLQGLTVAEAGAMGPAGIRDARVRNAETLKKIGDLAKSKEWIERAKYYADQAVTEKETAKEFARATAEKRPNQAERRASIEVPATNVPEDNAARFTDDELEELTKPDEVLAKPEAKPTTTPKPVEFSDAEIEALASPEPSPAPIPAEPPESVTADQPAAKTEAPAENSADSPQSETSVSNNQQIIADQSETQETSPETEKKTADPAENSLPSVSRAQSTLKSMDADWRELKTAGDRLEKNPAIMTEADVRSYIENSEKAATTHYPEAVAPLVAAKRALQEGDLQGAYAEAVKVRRGIRREWNIRTAKDYTARNGTAEEIAQTLKTGIEERAINRANLGIESPKAEPVEKPVPRIPPHPPASPRIASTTARERLIRDGAAREMEAWAQSVRDVQNQQKRGQSSMTMESNAAGKEIEEEQDKAANSIHSLGVKEGSPLASFEENPDAIAEAIEDKSGRLKDSKKAQLYQRAVKAFREAFEDAHGKPIDDYLAKATDEQKRDLFGDDAATLNFEEGKTESGLGRTEEEGLQKLAGGRKIEQLKEGKVFDEGRLVYSELFGGQGGAQDFLPTDERATTETAPAVDDSDISFDFGEKGHAPILDDAVRSLSETIDAVRDYVTLDVVPRLSKAGAQKEAVAHASTRTVVPRMINDLLARVFPESYKNPEAMAKAVRIMVLDNILGGYDDLGKAAEWLRKEQDAAAGEKGLNRIDKMMKAVEGRHDLAAYDKEVRAVDADTAAAIQRWKTTVNPVMDQLYNEMKGMDPNTPRDGRGRVFGARVNLLANSHTPEWLKATVREDEPLPQQPAANVSSYRNPNVRADRFDRMARFTASEYSNDPVAVLASALFPRWNEVTKRHLYNKLVDTGWAAWEKPENGMIHGQEVRGAPVQIPETIDGKTRSVTKVLWLPKSLHEEFRGVLGTDLPLKANPVSAALTKLQLAQLADATAHLKNIHSVIAAAQGTKGLLADAARKMPGISSADTFARIGKVMYDIAQDTPEIRAELAGMAKQGMLRQHFPATGLQKITKMQDLIHSVDTASRVVMNRFYDNLVERELAKDTFESRRAFVQQIGEYNKRLVGPLQRAASQSGLAPFIVAGRNFNRFSRRLLTGNPGFSPSSTQAMIQSRLVNFATLGSMFTIPMMLNQLIVGTIWGRPGTPIGAIDLGGKEDNRGNHKVLDLLQLYGVRRGMRGYGLQAISEGLQNGDSVNDIVGKAIYDAASTAAHPWLGPALGFGFQAMTGQRLDLRGGPAPEQASKMDGKGSQFVENMRVAAKNQNLLLYSPLRKAFSDTEVSPVKDFAKDFLKAPASAVGISDRQSPALQAARDAAIHVQTTPAQKERSQARRQILAAWDVKDENGARKLESEATSKRLVSPADLSEIHREIKMAPIERATWREPLEDILKVWDKASPDEKKVLRRLIALKVSNARPDNPALSRAQALLRAPR